MKIMIKKNEILEPMRACLMKKAQNQVQNIKGRWKPGRTFQHSQYTSYSDRQSTLVH